MSLGEASTYSLPVSDGIRNVCRLRHVRKCARERKKRNVRVIVYGAPGAALPYCTVKPFGVSADGVDTGVLC